MPLNPCAADWMGSNLVISTVLQYSRFELVVKFHDAWRRARAAQRRRRADPHNFLQTCQLSRPGVPSSRGDHGELAIAREAGDRAGGERNGALYLPAWRGVASFTELLLLLQVVPSNKHRGGLDAGHCTRPCLRMTQLMPLAWPMILERDFFPKLHHQMTADTPPSAWPSPWQRSRTA